MNIEVLTLPESDWEKYKNLRLNALQADVCAFGSTYEEDIQLTEADWRNRLSGETSLAVFARDVDKNELVGVTVVFWNTNHQAFAHIGEVASVYVDKAYRGMGIGSQLMVGLSKKLRQLPQIKKLKLEVNVSQLPATRLYEKFGFTKVGILRQEMFVENHYVDVILMEKLLF